MLGVAVAHDGSSQFDSSPGTATVETAVCCLATGVSWGSAFALNLGGRFPAPTRPAWRTDRNRSAANAASGAEYVNLHTDPVTNGRRRRLQAFPRVCLSTFRISCKPVAIEAMGERQRETLRRQRHRRAYNSVFDAAMPLAATRNRAGAAKWATTRWITTSKPRPESPSSHSKPPTAMAGPRLAPTSPTPPRRRRHHESHCRS